MKKVLIGLLIALLVGCSQGRTQKNASTSGNSISVFPKILALKDGKKESAQIDIYGQEFEKLKKLCIESDKDLAGMIDSIVKKEKAYGDNSATNLDTLKSFNDMAESGFERKPGKCMEIYLTLNNNLKELNESNK
ncbi:hypothetical protein [Fischerella sp. PCC 9605]|uniref:hypothetical protein n=1 Tax=Fischerella sp. PCC 9605 TaxID=1173024 RepID=UPI00047C7E0F|nr:hypothetical protein [Fischerella sp. PCC 9605]